MTRWFQDFSIDKAQFSPCHGPGSVAELTGDTSVLSKYRLIAPDQLTAYVFRKYADLDVYSYLPFVNDGVTTHQATVIFVPKSAKTLRAISKEPATFMFYEQGVSKELDRHIRRHPELSKHICLQRQELQREMALEASSTREYATVDLSAASDSISFDLVKSIFRDTTLYPYLVALRSRTAVLPSGKVTTMAKYAPMGSALSFPIESLIFACIVECTKDYVYHTTGVLHDRWRVYGDDIIVADALLGDLLVNLQLCGFTPNWSKTYGGNHRFRESCGCDAYDGTDVSPMKIGRKFSSRDVHVRSAGLFEALITMANSAHDYEFWLLRRYIVDKLIHSTGWAPHFSDDGLCGLYSSTPTNFHLKARWRSRYQREEIRATMPDTYQSHYGIPRWDSKAQRYRDQEPESVTEEERYYRWLRAAASRTATPFESAYLLQTDDSERVRLHHWFYLASMRKGDPLADDFCIESKIGSSGTYLAKRWIVKPAER